jgi:hypothetical protein
MVRPPRLGCTASRGKPLSRSVFPISQITGPWRPVGMCSQNPLELWSRPRMSLLLSLAGLRFSAPPCVYPTRFPNLTLTVERTFMGRWRRFADQNSTCATWPTPRTRLVSWPYRAQCSTSFAYFCSHPSGRGRPCSRYLYRTAVSYIAVSVFYNYYPPETPCRILHGLLIFWRKRT